MASLANQTISSTYDGLIKTSTDQPVPISGVQLLEDGVGNSLALSVGRANQGATVTGTLTATSLAGTLSTAAQPNITSVGTLSSLAVSGNVGIGTSSPNAEIQVVRSGNSRLRLETDDSGNSSIQFADATSPNVGQIQYKHSEDAMLFQANGSERMRIDSSGNVGIGTSPDTDAELHIYRNGSAARVRVEREFNPQLDLESLNGYAQIGTLNNFPLAFQTNGSERMRISSTGKIGIGTSTPVNIGHIKTSTNGEGLTLQINSVTEGDYSQLSFLPSTAEATAPPVYIRGVRGSSVSTSYLTFNTDSTERMRINSSGNVGIGQSSPVQPLHISSTQRPYVHLTSDSTGHLGTDGTSIGFTNQNGEFEIRQRESQSILFKTADTERMRIQADGNILIGTTTASTAKMKIDHSDNSPVISIESTNASYTATQFLINQTSSTAGQLARFRSQGVNRFIINGDGDILINKTTFSNAGAGIMMRSASSDGGQIRLTREDNTNTQFHLLFYTNGGSGIGSISTTTSGTQFNISGSDLRLKKNIDDWSDSVLTDFAAIEPKLFHFNEQEDTEQKIKGYIAQDMVDKFPEAYPQNEEGYYNYNPSGMVVYLMKAVKELTAEIETLKSQINA